MITEFAPVYTGPKRLTEDPVFAVTNQYAFEFHAQAYAPSQDYDGRFGHFDFRKHLYGRIGDFDSKEEVDTANARLLKLRTVLADRYGGSSTDELLNQVFSQPTQDGQGKSDDEKRQ